MEDTDTPRNPNIEALVDLLAVLRAVDPDATHWQPTLNEPQRFRRALQAGVDALHELDVRKPSKNRDRIEKLERGLDEALSMIYLQNDSIKALTDTAETLRRSVTGLGDKLAEETKRRQHWQRETSNRLGVIPSLDRQIKEVTASLSEAFSMIRQLDGSVDALGEKIDGVDRVTSEAFAFASSDRLILRRNIGDVSDELTRQIQERRSENQDTLEVFRDRLDRLTELVGSEPSSLRAEVDGLADRIRHLANRIDTYTGARPAWMAQGGVIPLASRNVESADA